MTQLQIQQHKHKLTSSSFNEQERNKKTPIIVNG